MHLSIIFVDAGLELVPKSLWSHPSVRATAARRGKKPGEILLDKSLHYHAMKRLPLSHKRGRPDILHVCLLLALSSILNKEGWLRVYVETLEKRWITINPETRLPRNYNRFVGLMEQLLVYGKVPPSANNPLIRVEHFSSLRKKFAEIGLSKVYLLSEKGKPMKVRQLAEEIIHEKSPGVLIGCFPRGDVSEEVKNSADETVSIAPYPLDAWTVTCRIISSVEDVVEARGERLENPGEG
ncbi:MAG TPA: 16S rRNA methyltransferase [Thermofilum sp.]|nr:16S rRNA methyltransferase [Thermofilum sp.]